MAETLSSNVVNYLVWRYLQEAGYGNAALQLARCWVRDPETLPFATNVAPHTLIRLLQDGMSFDQLQAEVSRSEPRYSFGANHGRPYSARNALLTLDQGIPAHQLAAEAANGIVQEPPPKKTTKRKKARTAVNGVETRPWPRAEPEVNGDAMEVEQNGTTHAPDSVRAGSEAAVSQADSPTVTDIPISTLSIGQDVEIQTEIIQDLTSDTMFVQRSKDTGVQVQHTSWGPAESPVLLAAGKSVLQVHLIDKSSEENAAESLRTEDLHTPGNNFEATAVCWKSDGDMAVSAREESFNVIGEKILQNRLINYENGGRALEVISSQAGLVTTLRYHRPSKHLMSISTDGEKGSLKIWKEDSNAVPAYSWFTDTAIIDAQFFMVQFDKDDASTSQVSSITSAYCGIRLFGIFHVDVLGEDGPTVRNGQVHNTEVTWETLKTYEEQDTEAKDDHRIAAALGLYGDTAFLGLSHYSGSTFSRELETVVYPDEYPTDLDFCRKKPDQMSASGPILATSSMTGVVRIWSTAENDCKCIKKLSTIDDMQIFKIAFSPDSQLLAAAGPDGVTVWDIERREVPIASWRAKDVTIEKWNPTVDAEFSFGWHPDSSKLSIALGNQIAIIPVPR